MFDSINNFGFSFSNKFNSSIDWIIISGLVFGSIIIWSIAWLIKISFSFSNKLIESNCCIIFCFLGISFNSNWSIFWISFSGIFFSSINMSSIIWIFKGIFTFGGINIWDNISISFNGLGIFNIVIKEDLCSSCSFFCKASINIESIFCKYKSFLVFNTFIPSNPSISKVLNVGIYGVFSIKTSSTNCLCNCSFSFACNSKEYSGFIIL